SFTRNFGKEPALFAGLDHATGEAIIPIDVDLQDPIEVIPNLIEKWQAGADMVLAKRSDHSTDSRLKRKSAEWFYKLHNKISNPQIEENVGDFRLMSREVVENIKLMPRTKMLPQQQSGRCRSTCEVGKLKNWLFLQEPGSIISSH
ncbi:glycosyltransferase family 2 protein, partial [Bacillus sp. HC-Mk]